MASKEELDTCYMTCAEAHAALSKANRRKVGAALVTRTGIVVGACNGLPRQLGNVCETADNVTKEEVIHAENNCILKCAKEGVSTELSVMYVTTAPCRKCASMLISAGVWKVIYRDEYNDMTGIELLKQSGVFVEKWRN